MSLGIDPASDRAVFRQIADHLRADIESGELEPGAKLPSERALMAAYGAARGTVRQAIAQLRNEGLVEVEHGRGAFVRRRPPVRRLESDRFVRRHRQQGKVSHLAEVASEAAPEATTTVAGARAGARASVGGRGAGRRSPPDSEPEGRRLEAELIRVGPEAAPAEIACRLGLVDGETVLVRCRRYLADGAPMEIATSYVPWKIAEGTAMAEPDTGPGGLYARIEERGHLLGRFTEEVAARMPHDEERRALRLPPGTPVMTLVRTAYDQAGGAVEVCATVLAADRYVLAYDLPAQ